MYLPFQEHLKLFDRINAFSICYRATDINLVFTSLCRVHLVDKFPGIPRLFLSPSAVATSQATVICQSLGASGWAGQYSVPQRTLGVQGAKTCISWAGFGLVKILDDKVRVIIAIGVN